MATRMGLWPDGFVEGHDFSRAVKARIWQGFSRWVGCRFC
jgi:hypothetical protein